MSSFFDEDFFDGEFFDSGDAGGGTLSRPIFHRRPNRFRILHKGEFKEFESDQELNDFLEREEAAALALSPPAADEPILAHAPAPAVPRIPELVRSIQPATPAEPSPISELARAAADQRRARIARSNAELMLLF